MADEESAPQGEAPDHTPPYIIFLLVLFFFLTGLLGFLICHVLKKKGYRCRTGEPEEEESEGKLTREDTEDCVPDDQAEDQDTVEQIVKCIIENEANAEALKEMLVNQEPAERTDPRFSRQDSAGSLPPHHHTVHSGSERTACHHCNQSRAKRARGRARAPRSKTRLRETTVFSVGRFRVTHIGKKSGNQEKTGQSEQAEGDTLQKDGKVGQSETESHEKCSLREMFKDTPTDDTNALRFTNIPTLYN
ncbi:RELT-like protein 2 isoform X2 [Polyodon spathula]|uniref:RELT-like protein 2 isoform X2 n=1 Tax=Polyodon spathula TaxID=7913 RepID=UPI001B7E01AD|nr:RELT-like protein 2 isoform X2 [Polyodon spathula]